MRSSDSFFRSNRPYQDQDVLRALEKNNDLVNSGNQKFSEVIDVMEKSTLANSKTMQNASQELAEQIAKQAEIDREEREAQHRESMFMMMDVASGISMLDDTFRESSEMIAKQIQQSGIDIINEIKVTNQALRSIDNNLLNINEN